MNAMTFGSYNKAFEPVATDFDWLSRDADEVRKYVDDPRCGEVFTAGFFADLLGGVNRLGELAASAGEDKLLVAAGPVLGALRDHTNESAQLFRRQGEHRVCVSAAERPVGLRDSIPVGATLSMHAGSAAQVLLAWEEPDRLHRGLQGSKFTATMLSGVRRRGWAQSVSEREQGVASVSAPVRSPSGRVIAAVSISGPVERVSRQPGRLHAATVVAGANKLTEVLARAAAQQKSVAPPTTR